MEVLWVLRLSVCDLSSALVVKIRKFAISKILHATLFFFFQMPRSYNRLALALARVTHSERVWAIDVPRISEDGSRYVGKKFWTGTVGAMYDNSCWNGKPSIYEVITERDNVRLYLDCEFDLSDTQLLTKEDVFTCVQFIRSCLNQHLRLSFPSLDINPNELIILHGCTPIKMSLHLIHRSIIFDNAQCSCASYVHELNAFLRHQLEDSDLNDFLKENLKKIIDLSVYQKNQLYRTYGASKLDKMRPFILYDESNFDWALNPNWSFSQMQISLEAWCRTLVTVDIFCHSEILQVQPSEFLSVRSPELARQTLYHTSCFTDNMDPQGRYLQKFEMPQVERVPMLVLSSHVPRASSNSETVIVDDTMWIVNEHNNPVRLSDLEHNQCVFCLKCETQVAGSEIRGVGISSAKAFLRPNGTKCVFCFNCSYPMYILETADQYGFVPTEEEIIKSPHDKLNFAGSEDIDFDACSRLVFLDAPMGTGKTHVSQWYLSRHGEKSVLAITFRISLAKYTSERLGLKCYTDSDAFNNPEHHHRFVVCLDSLWKVEKTDYDILLLDEGTFLQYHFVSGTKKGELAEVIDVFKCQLQNAKKVIVMHDRIPESTIDFYANLMGLNPDNKSEVTKRKFEKPTPLRPVLSYEDKNVMILQMIKDYIGNFNEADMCSNRPFVVFCSRADYALLLLYILRQLATEKFGDQVCTLALTYAVN
ncbi:hypothetical protein K450DRAFT_263007 [Umbelopsis ramanniana AG]|uniref:DNA-directed primase/polymerase protein n=1 Tax=Umbelopsis ramanniana AG TaxID=1314678 RepID=A0AAD5E196_UMBRA|nr:uncharacterized protein K450DRAFT_263007 [Umbelopsis ramanniana AG]KAI8575167.1 hypothetical protein K450DRAFT_263007 [Umbelopsis ramanniana AG]